jgi:hypothetical protein
MAIHMAIGLLFLGGGMATLSQTNEAIAALLCAFFPVFPCNMADNKLHFQGAGRIVLEYQFLGAVQECQFHSAECSTTSISVASSFSSVHTNSMEQPDRYIAHSQCCTAALRHLYVLAVESRTVIARETADLELCHVPITVHVRDGQGGVLRMPKEILLIFFTNDVLFLAKIQTLACMLTRKMIFTGCVLVNHACVFCFRFLRAV